MAYIPKIIAPEEKLIGIARCHWIYVVKGLVWFGILAASGWAVYKIILAFAFLVADMADSASGPLLFMNLADGALWMGLGAGFLIFFFFVLKVLVTEVGLSTRRILLKEGLLFVNVKQVDLEEVRGEELDLGHLGRILGYGYLNLDCRFIGDMPLPAIENPEGFLNALHLARSKTQDALAIVVGKGDKQTLQQQNISQPLEVDMSVKPPEQPTPEIQPGEQPTVPEVRPQPTTPSFPETPEIPTMPTPHNPPPQNPTTAPPGGPEQIPQPIQPTPPPPNPEPPLQPPTESKATDKPVVAVVDPDAVAKALEQTMPHMVEEVVKKMSEKGLIANQNAANDDDDIDTDLISSFDEASEEGSGHALRNQVEQSIH